MVWPFPIRLIISMLFLAIPDLFLGQGFPRAFEILFSEYLLIQIFFYNLFVPIFYSEIVLHPLHLFGGKSSCIFHLHYGRIFFRYFRTSCFYCIIKYSLEIFHIRVSWWSFTGVWVTASLLKSPGLFSVFWLFSIM